MSAGPKSFLRTYRWVQTAGLVICAADLVRFLSETHLVAAAVAAVTISFWTLLIRRTTNLIGRHEHLASRPRPDYASIAAMEREIYGETFEHEGAPQGDPVAELRAAMDDLAERATARRNMCIGCGHPHTIASGRCGVCYRRWKAGRDYEDEHRPNLRWN